MNQPLKIFFAAAMLFGACTGADARGTDAEMHSFVDSLMQKMTLQQKIGQLNLCGANGLGTGPIATTDIAPRLSKGEVGGVLNLMGAERVAELQKYAVENDPNHIPLIFGLDVIHGYRTIFPIPLGLSATWNMPLIEESARVAAVESGSDGINWTYSPMVDICRDPRWGRQSEGSGEDVYLGSEIAKAMVKGYQGDNTFSEPGRIMACVKHVALYGAPDGGRDYNTVDMSRQRMYNEYLPPYQAAVDAGVGSAMSSFNTVDGIPASGNRWVLTDLLRNQWGFDGFVVSDAGSIQEMRFHGMGDMRDVAVLALKAGLDMDLGAEAYTRELEGALQQGRIKEADIDLACRRILEAKYKLGLFDDPYRFCDVKKAKKVMYSKEHRDFARKAAAESFVLLKNEGNILPLKKQGKIALIGPILDTRDDILGTWAWCADSTLCTPILDAFKKRLGKKGEILYARGAEFIDSVPSDIYNYTFGRDASFKYHPANEAAYQQAVDAAEKADVVVAFLGEHKLSSGESSSRTNLELPKCQKELLRRLMATGKPVVLVNFSGRAVVLTDEAATVPAILQVWSPGSEAGDALFDVLFGDVNPSGKLTVSFPRNVGQLPMHYDELPTGRPAPADGRTQKFTTGYIDSTTKALYPFGYGLSYTTFDYSPVHLSADKMAKDGAIDATVTVTNTGSREGDETVQLYLRDVVGSISRPIKQLKGFEKIHLKPGESRDVTFRITPEMLKFYNYNLDFVAEPGEFIVMTGPDSERLTAASFTLLP